MLKLDLGENGGQLAVLRFTELLEWVESEQRAWRWLEVEALRRPELAGVCRHQLGAVGRLHTELMLLQRQPRARRRKALAAFAHLLRNFYRRRLALHSTSAYADLVFDLRELEPEAALHALAYFLDMDVGALSGGESARRGREAAERLEEGLTAMDSAEGEDRRRAFRRRIDYYHRRMRAGDF